MYIYTDHNGLLKMYMKLFLHLTKENEWVGGCMGGGGSIYEHKSEEKPLEMYIKLFLHLTKENGWLGGWMGWR